MDLWLFYKVQCLQNTRSLEKKWKLIIIVIQNKSIGRPQTLEPWATTPVRPF